MSPNNPQGLFVTGTDTGIGKTLIATALIRTLKRRGLRVAGMKPVAAGAEQTSKGLRNDDAVALADAANVAAPYELINPYCLPLPASPHIAAGAAAISIDPDTIRRSFDELAAQSDFVVVEGAGGWLAPISDTQTMANIAQALNLPVLIVVGLRLGCLNHTLLTAEVIRASGLRLAGWIGNHVDPHFAHAAENLALLELRLGQPPLAVVPFRTDTETTVELAQEAAMRLLDAPERA